MWSTSPNAPFLSCIPAVKTFCRRTSLRNQHLLSRSVHQTAKTIFSGIQPTGVPHLGNYLGALREWVRLQDTLPSQTQVIFSVVDLHAITIRQDAAQLRRRKRESLAMLLAIGLDPQRCILFHQSDVSAHAELMWILACMASTGKLDRMTQWKDKTRSDANASGEKHKLGLYAYPVLQAADILLYRATHVPVGEDQAQHLELSRELANTFNHYAGKSVLTAPQTLLGPASRVMSLSQPSSKMSKSDADEKSHVLLTDSAENIHAKFKAAKTDSIAGISYDTHARPGVSNLLSILHTIRGREDGFSTVQDLARARSDASLRGLKEEVAGAVENVVRPIRERFSTFVNDEDMLRKVADQGAARAHSIAAETMQKVKAAVGLDTL